jgi:hypothetical protein
MKWSEFKDAVDKALKDENKEDVEIFYIDTGNCPDKDRIDISLDKLGELIIQS